jgi:hypothetical protein
MPADGAQSSDPSYVAPMKMTYHGLRKGRDPIWRDDKGNEYVFEKAPNAFHWDITFARPGKCSTTCKTRPPNCPNSV